MPGAGVIVLQRLLLRFRRSLSKTPQTLPRRSTCPVPVGSLFAETYAAFPGKSQHKSATSAAVFPVPGDVFFFFAETSAAISDKSQQTNQPSLSRLAVSCIGMQNHIYIGPHVA